MQDFKKLLVWKKSHALVLCIYRLTKSFPAHERFELVRQMRGAAVSIPANIAEGSRRAGFYDDARFLNMSQGSGNELEYYLILAPDLGYGDRPEADATKEALLEVQRMLEALRKLVLKRAQEDERRPRRRPDL